MSKYFEIYSLTHEIAFALFRVAVLVRHERLRRELEGAAIELVKSIEAKIIDSLLRLIRLTEAVGEMNQINARILSRELAHLRQMILGNMELSFSYPEIPRSFAELDEKIDLENLFKREAESPENQELESPVKRQEAIRQFIRQFPEGCRMKDLSTRFGNFSERTIRSDIQKLVSKGLIEKVGSKTGSFSFLRAVTVPTELMLSNPDLTNLSKSGEGEKTSPEL